MTKPKLEYYIITTAHTAIWPGGVILFWAANREGYSTFLEKAGRYSEAEAKEICTFRHRNTADQVDFMVPCEEVEAQAVRVVDIDKLRTFIGEKAMRRLGQ